MGNKITYDPKITQKNIVGCIYTDTIENNICVIIYSLDAITGPNSKLYLTGKILTGDKRGKEIAIVKRHIENMRLPTLEDVKTYKIYELVHSQKELNNLFSSHFNCPKMLETVVIVNEENICK